MTGWGGGGGGGGGGRGKARWDNGHGRSSRGGNADDLRFVTAGESGGRHGCRQQGPHVISLPGAQKEEEERKRQEKEDQRP